jgi:beta-glucosidase
VLLNGSAVSINWASEHIPGIVELWYPGQAGGTALADVLFGDYNPAGRLPITFYKTTNQLPPFDDYKMKGRTYRYFDGEPLYPFGFGLSYSRFTYSNLKIPKQVQATGGVTVSVEVKNSDAKAGDEVVQLYIQHLAATVPVPIRALEGFQRIALKPGEKKTVVFNLTPRELSVIRSDNKRAMEAGIIEISVGGKQPGFTGAADAITSAVLTGQTRVSGTKILE